MILPVRKFSVILLIVFFAGSPLAAVEIGPGLRIFQFEQGSNVNFSQSQNFSQLGVRSQLTDFGNSNFSVEPESSASAELDFYKPFADRQDFLTNFTARSSPSQEVNFSLSNLPSDDFYEAFFSNNDTRVFIGFTDQLSRFNFSTTLLNANLSVFNYGEKGVAIDNITFNDSEPVEGGTLGIEEEIFNEGVVDDEAVNKTLTISTYNGSGWQQEQFRSEDLAVPVENTETEQSFTARFKGSFTNTTQYRNGGGQLGLGYQNGTSGDNLVSFLRLDTGTPEDYSGEDLSVSKSGGGLLSNNGILSTNSYRFDGNNFVEVNNRPEFSQDNITVSVWVNKTGSGIYNNKGVTGKWGSTNSFVLWTSADNSEFKPQFSVVTSDGRSDAKTGSVLDPGLHHLVGVFNGSSNLFVDGQRVASGSEVTGTIQSSSESLVLGSYTDETGRFTINSELDELRVLNESLSQEEVEELFLNGKITGNYTTKEIDNNELTKWYRVNLDANIPDQTELEAEFRALDSNGNVVDTDSFNVEGGDNYYNVSVQDSYGAELYLNGSSENVTKSWEVNQLQVISGGPYVDPWEVKPGPFRFNVSLDPNDEVKETDETNNNASEILNVDSYQVFYGGSDSSKIIGNGSRDIYRWDPQQDQGLLFFSDVDSNFEYSNLEPVNGSDLIELDNALKLRGHNDSTQELWDRDGDGEIDRTESWEVGDRTVQVPVTNSTENSPFDTGILYDSGDGTPYIGSQDLVFVTKLDPDTTGSFGTYDYEARIPFSLRELRAEDDLVDIDLQLE
jgi:hypothetical protein